MTNLLKETEADIKRIDKTPEDIKWIGSYNGKYACTWSQFKELANFEYDCGFGSAEVAIDLVIVFTDGTWFDRHEYDGSEWWSFNEVPVICNPSKVIDRLTKHECMMESLETLHEEE